MFWKARNALSRCAPAERGEHAHRDLGGAANTVVDVSRTHTRNVGDFWYSSKPAELPEKVHKFSYMYSKFKRNCHSFAPSGRRRGERERALARRH